MHFVTQPIGPLPNIVIGCLTTVFIAGFLAVSPASSAFAGDPIDLPPVILQILRNEAVYRELQLSDDEIGRVEVAVDSIDGDWWRSRIMQDAQRIATVQSLTNKLKGELEKILRPQSYSRLLQLERQSLGTRMFLDADVASLLTLSPQTIEKMIAVVAESDTKAKALQQRLQAGESAQALEPTRQEITKQELNSIVALLSNEQKLRIKELTGPTFNYSQILRSYPRAPELLQTQDQWLQGTLTSLKDLRGKVVALHFYAFQCINCQRNLPHYSGWYDDYADKGLVVIGIQTPETSSERDPDRVARAAKEQTIRYPILMDPASKNWQAWGNTMWPTVYLIDREGYIRTWWQGEMNWQGKEGEKQMRGNIETLLNESPVAAKLTESAIDC
jgi:peroxiredoxin